MKRTYFAPATRVVYLKDPICLDIASGVATNSDAMGRGHNRDLWDDEEE